MEKILTRKDFKKGDWVIGRDGYFPITARKVLKISLVQCEYNDPNMPNRKKSKINNGCYFGYLRKATKNEIAKAVRQISARKAKNK